MEGTRLVLDTLHWKGWGIHDVQWGLEGTDKDSRRDREEIRVENLQPLVSRQLSGPQRDRAE